MSWEVIAHHEVGATPESSVTFTDGGAWSSYTDLKLVVSIKTDGTSGTYDTCFLHINGSEESGGTQVYSTGTTDSSHGVMYLYTVNDGVAQPVYSNGEIYFFNFQQSGKNRSIMPDIANNNINSATIFYFAEESTANTNAISSIGFVPLSTNLKQYSTLTLYGLASGNDGTAVVS